MGRLLVITLDFTLNDRKKKVREKRIGVKCGLGRVCIENTDLIRSSHSSLE